jgi:hypothetical protein
MVSEKSEHNLIQIIHGRKHLKTKIIIRLKFTILVQKREITKTELWEM